MVFWFGFRHLSNDTIGGFSIILHASAYSVLPSIAGGLSISINMVICINNDYVNRYYSQEKGVGKATSPINNYRTSKISATV